MLLPRQCGSIEEQIYGPAVPVGAIPLWLSACGVFEIWCQINHLRDDRKGRWRMHFEFTPRRKRVALPDSLMLR